MPREASEDCVVGGFDVPRHTMLVINSWAIHRDPEVWEDPTEFRPERFEGWSGEGSEGYKPGVIDPKIHIYIYIYMLGAWMSRGCPGQPVDWIGTWNFY